LFVGEDSFHRGLNILQERVIADTVFEERGVANERLRVSKESARNRVGSNAMVKG
jgi:hypothetical protein